MVSMDAIHLLGRRVLFVIKIVSCRKQADKLQAEISEFGNRSNYFEKNIQALSSSMKTDQPRVEISILIKSIQSHSHSWAQRHIDTSIDSSIRLHLDYTNAAESTAL